jgi:hypothetical protein
MTSAHFLRAGGEVGLQTQQLVAGADHAIQTGLVQAQFLQEIAAIGFVELRNLRFDRRAHRDDFRILFDRALTHGIEVRIVLEAVLRDIRDVHERLERDQMQLLQQPPLLGILDQRPRRLAAVQMIAQLLQQIALPDRILVAGLRGLLRALQTALDGIEIGERQLGVDHFDVIERLDAARDVHDVVVFETAHDVRDRIRLANVREELVAKPFALGRAGHQSRDIDELDRRRQDLRRIDDTREHVETRVRHRHDTDVRIDRAERVVLGRDLRARQRVEESRLADVRQPDDAALDTH